MPASACALLFPDCTYEWRPQYRWKGRNPPCRPVALSLASSLAGDPGSCVADISQWIDAGATSAALLTPSGRLLLATVALSEVVLLGRGSPRSSHLWDDVPDLGYAAPGPDTEEIVVSADRPRRPLTFVSSSCMSNRGGFAPCSSETAQARHPRDRPLSFVSHRRSEASR